jgi:high-affinity K+ transport system ATPase subunit B
MDRSKGLRGALANLLPHRLFERSQNLFVIEVALLAILIGTMAAFLAGAIGNSLGIVLAMVGLLAGVLLVGATIERSRSTKKPTASAAISAPTTAHRSYRATNFRQLQQAGLIGATAGPATAAGISSHIDLEAVEPDRLNVGDVILVEAGQVIPVDGLILDGVAVVDESAVTGQSAPVIRHGEGVNVVMGQTRVVEGHIFVEVSPRRGHPLDWIGGGSTETSPTSPEAVQQR